MKTKHVHSYVGLAPLDPHDEQGGYFVCTPPPEGEACEDYTAGEVTMRLSGVVRIFLYATKGIRLYPAHRVIVVSIEPVTP